MGGWRKNQEAEAERNLLVVIPGRNRREAVIMADRYDTAFMEDRYANDSRGGGARISACGADDNHSATAAMMLAAPIFLEMSRQGKLGCDIWLVHLTGEEFPADCLGARALTERLVERTLKLHLPRGKSKDLSKTTVRGVYVSDMIAHNHDRERDIFQISPGNDPGSRRPRARPPQSARRRDSGDGAISAAIRPRARALRSAEHALQHGWADFLRCRRTVRAIHGELRHQSHGLS
jgi:hypothetical protein